MNTILQKRIEKAATFLFKQRGLDKESCRQAMYYILSNQWISVSEVLPEFQQSVVVTNSEGDYWTSWRLNDNCEDTDDNGFVNNGIGEITHWMMIPTINKEEK